MEHICGFVIAAASPGKPGGFSGSRPTDKRQMRDQEASDRELFARDRGAFNVKQRQDYEHQKKARESAKKARKRR